jgi:hypothetical protein
MSPTTFDLQSAMAATGRAEGSDSFERVEAVRGWQGVRRDWNEFLPKRSLKWLHVDDVDAPVRQAFRLAV